MPKRRFSRKRRFTRRRRRRVTVRKVARQVRAIRKAVEVKAKNEFHGIAPVTTTPTALLLNSQTLGSLQSDRIGAEYKMIGLHLKWSLRITQDTADATYPSIVRVMVVLFGATPAAALPGVGAVLDLIDDQGSPVAIPAALAHKFYNTRKNNRILFDRKFPMGALGSSNNGGAGVPVRYGEKFIRMGSKAMFGDGASVAINRGQLVLFAMDAFNSRTNLQVNSRLYYVDP